MNGSHHHGGSSHRDLPESGDLIALLRSVQSDLSDTSDEATDGVAARLDEAVEGVTALGDALDRERAYSAHLKEHYIDFETSESYRLGHAIIRTVKAPGRLLASLRAGRG